MCTHAGYPECTITNEGSMTFSHEAFQNKTVTAEQLLQGLAAKDTKVVYLLTGIAEMRDLFAAVYRTQHGQARRGAHAKPMPPGGA